MRLVGVSDFVGLRVPGERLRRLERSIVRRCAPEEIITDNRSWPPLDAWSYGDVYVLEQLWWRVGVGEVLREVLGEGKFDFDLERAVVRDGDEPGIGTVRCWSWVDDAAVFDASRLHIHAAARAA